MSANYELRGDVAVITMDNPPVNGLGYETRRGIAEGLDKALADAKVKAIVVTGAGKAFSGGADIREFGSPKSSAEPNLLSLIAAFEASPKPIVAAIHSVAMGGGLELALGSHYRVAAAGAQIALPGVKIGIHEGPCLAVMLNERQDYFGQTVNVAARVQGLSTSQAIHITSPVNDAPAVAAMLGKAAITPIQKHAALRGVADKIVVYEIP